MAALARLSPTGQTTRSAGAEWRNGAGAAENDPVDLAGSAALTATPDRVFAEVANLDTYPGWLGLVREAVRVDRHPDDPGPAWMVDLGARLGPIQRTKRVRMVRVEGRPPKLVRFERVEHDGRRHSAWVLTAEVERAGRGSHLTVRLHYGGNLRIPGLEARLRDEIRRGAGRLESRLAPPGH